MKSAFPKLAISLAIFTLTACGGGSSGDSESEVTSPVNQSPTANAGTDQTVYENTEVTLTGTGHDVDGTITAYKWTQTSGKTVSLVDADTNSVTFTAPDINSVESLEFELSVTDNEGASATDNVSITIEPKNNPPEANAGRDMAVEIGTEVTLDGSLSADIDENPITYNWELVSPEGSNSVLTLPNSVSPSFTPDTEGDYTVSLIVNDGTVDSEVSSVIISSTIPLWVTEFSEATNISVNTVINSCLLNESLECIHSYGRNLSMIATIENEDLTLKLASWIGSYTGQYNWLELDAPDVAPYNELITDMWVVADEKRGIKLYEAPILDSSYTDGDEARIIKRASRAVGNSEEIPNAFIDPSTFHITIKDRDGFKSNIGSFDENGSKGLVAMANLLNEHFEGAYTSPLTDDQLRALSETTGLDIEYLRSLCSDNGINCFNETNNQGQPIARFNIYLTQTPINAIGSNNSVSIIDLGFDTDGGFSMYLQYVEKGEVPLSGSLGLETELGNECLTGVSTAFIVEQEQWDSMGYRVQSAWGEKIESDSTFWGCVLNKESFILKFDSNIGSTTQTFDDKPLKLSKFSEVFSLINQ